MAVFREASCYLRWTALLFLAAQVCALQCYCYFDPGESGLHKDCSGNATTCNRMGPQAACVYTRQLKVLESGGTTITVEYGCFVPLFGDSCFELDSNTSVAQCCSAEDLCNQDFNKLLPFERVVIETPTEAAPSTVNPATAGWAGASAAAVVIIVLVITTAVVVMVVYGRHKRHVSTELVEDNGRLATVDLVGDLEGSISSGSGGGKPFLQRRTIAKEIELKEQIGAGRYGRVYRGLWRGDEYAVKTFHTTDEKSWMRETEIYNQVLLPNENILSYLAGDIISNRGETQMWLITQYHPKGSLFDYLLHREPLTTDEAISLAVSAASGLVHLHTEIQGAQRKPAIAHRDIKSKNILVKSNGTCCIADFGMAVVQEIRDKKVNMPANPRVGTKRYMAPEILDETLDTNNFESFKRVDMYAFALVLWEICLMWKMEGQDCCYEVPYSRMVQADPSFDEMKEVVVIQKMRPSIPNQWKSDEVLWSVSQIITECWHFNPEVRLTALRVKKNLNRATANSTEKPCNGV